MDPWRSVKSAAGSYVGVPFFLGFFLVLLTYFSVSQQFTMRASNAVERSSSAHFMAATNSPPPPPSQELLTLPVDGEAQRKAICDVDDRSSDVCDVAGDIRINGSSSSILAVPPDSTGEPTKEWRIRPYTRKHMNNIPEVTVQELRSPVDAPACTVLHSVPAVVFATGGLIGNYWHDFNDVIIPLYLASRKFDGEVQFLVRNFQGWFIGKYIPILKKLSNYEIIDMDKDNQVRCFPRAVVGIRISREFGIDPSSKSANGLSMPEFTKFLRGVYGLPRDSPAPASSGKPRMMIISRRHPRQLVNVDDVVRMAETAGFEVVIGDPPFHVNVGEFARDVNSCDVMVGVHGAGLTNSLFLPTGGALVQIVPFGNLGELCRTDFGDPAVWMGLKYVAYNCSVEESTLVETLGREHPAVVDPESVHRSGWGKVAEFYLGKQDVRIDLDKFRPVLHTLLQSIK